MDKLVILKESFAAGALSVQKNKDFAASHHLPYSTGYFFLADF